MAEPITLPPATATATVTAAGTTATNTNAPVMLGAAAAQRPWEEASKELQDKVDAFVAAYKCTLDQTANPPRMPDFGMPEFGVAISNELSKRTVAKCHPVFCKQDVYQLLPAGAQSHFCPGGMMPAAPAEPAPKSTTPLPDTEDETTSTSKTDADTESEKQMRLYMMLGVAAVVAGLAVFYFRRN